MNTCPKWENTRKTVKKKEENMINSHRKMNGPAMIAATFSLNDVCDD